MSPALISLINAALMAGIIVLLVLTTVLIVELVAAHLLPSRRPRHGLSTTDDFVVVIPAHDEVGTIERTLDAVLSDMPQHGRVLVIADNCTDTTATVARAAGATVIERRDPSHVGKGYAIDFALRFLAASAPRTVVILDADCVPDRGTLENLVSASQTWNRPVQARYELNTPDISAGPLARIGTFAWRIKNVLRPSGLKALGVPCLLMGTGMAFPLEILAKADLDRGHLVEDMVLGLHLAARRQGAAFLPEACVRSAVPPSIEGQTSQRSRWETGHLQVIMNHVPKLFVQALSSGDWRLLVLALHTAVPPLALFGLLLCGTTALSGLMVLAGGSSWTFQLSALVTCGAGAVFATYWFTVGRDLLTAGELLQLPGYLVSKLSLYAGALTGRKVAWIRSKRD